MTSLEFSLFLHFTAAIAGLGSAFAQMLTYPVAKMLDPRSLPFKHRLQLGINGLLVLPALVVLLGTGIYQAEEVGYDLGDFWLTGAMAIVGILALMVIAYFIPEDRRLQRMAERDIAASGSGEVEISAEYRRRVWIESMAGVVADLLVIAAIYLMVTKPGL